MARDKRKVVIQSDNEARHSPRQKRARPLMQSQSGVVISEPTERHVTHQAKHVEARAKACFDCPTTKRIEAKHVEAKTKARFDRSTTPKTTRLTTTPLHPRTAPPTTSLTCPLSLGVCDDALGWTYLVGSLVKSSLMTYRLLVLMRAHCTIHTSPRPILFSRLEREYRELHFSIRGRADIISTNTIATTFGLPSSAPPEVIKTNIFPFGHFTECSGSVLWGLYHMYTASAQSYLIPLPQLLSYYLLCHGHQLPESDHRMASHTYVIDQWVRAIHSGSQLTTHGTRQKRDLHVVPLPSTTESPLPSTPTFDTSLPVLPISLPPPLLSALDPAIPISTPAILVSDLPRPSQPQVVDATSSTLSIMARLDTLQELFVSMDSRIDAHLSKMKTRMDDLTFSVQQLISLVIPSRQRGDFVTPADTSLEVDGDIEVIGSGSNTRAPTIAYETMPILQTSGAAGQVDGEIFIRATDTGMDIIIRDDPPMVQDVGEALHLSWRPLIRLLHLCWRI
ncbi:hypothetical protein AAG906_038422 [Vitis piasezkii]